MLDFTAILNQAVIKQLHQGTIASGFRAYLVGGFVRDAILQRPCKDIDIVVEGSGLDYAKKIAQYLGIKEVQYFKNFGTAMFKFQGFELEFVGARKESYQRSSRKPVVEEGSLKDDQLRRDFTINALSIGLNEDDFGTLYDPFNGYEHLTQKLIKTPQEPEITFSDDPLRMLRAIRFASQLNFKIYPETLKAITTQAKRIEIISGERIHEELNKILSSNKPSYGFKLLDQTGLLNLILPELAALKGVDEVDGKKHKENFSHTLQVVDNISHNTSNLWLRWAALLHDIGKAPTKRVHPQNGFSFHGHEFVGSKMVSKIFKRLHLPLNEKMKYVEKMVLLSSRPIAVADDEVSDSGVRRLLFDAGDDVDDLMTLCEADITTRNEAKKQQFLNNFKRVREKLKIVEEKDKLRNWQPPISGEEIMSTFGITPCKEVGIIKNAIREAILDGEIENEHHQAFKFMINQGKLLGLNPIQSA